jgi:hypothetical protein
MRTIAYNVYGCAGWPEAAAEEEWATEESGVADRIVAELDAAGPDLLTVSESPSEAVLREIAAGLGMELRVFPSRGDWPGALFTDFRIREAAAVYDLLADPPADLFTRHAGRALVTADDRELVVYSIHLHPSEETTRTREIERLREVLEPDLRSERPVLVQGDLNHRPDGPEYEAWRDLGLTDAAVAGGASAEPTFPADDPTRRIDYVWASDRLAGRLDAARVVSEPPFGRGADLASSGPFLSDHLPMRADFALTR